jgi:hypothetical protein
VRRSQSVAFKDGRRDDEPADQEQAQEERGGQAEGAVRPLLVQRPGREDVRGEDVERLDAHAEEQSARDERRPRRAAVRQVARDEQPERGKGNDREGGGEDPDPGRPLTDRAREHSSEREGEEQDEQPQRGDGVARCARARLSVQSSRWETIRTRSRLAVV